MRSTLIALALMTGGCLVEYVLPEGDSSGGPGTTQNSTTGDPAPTTGGADTTGDEQPTGDACDPGLTRCGEDCFDLARSDTHCGTCDEFCEDDEMCIASECREILVVACDACPCDACPSDDVLESTTGGGGDPSKYLCCPPAGGGEGTDSADSAESEESAETADTAETVLCVVGDPEDLLVCPEEA